MTDTGSVSSVSSVRESEAVEATALDAPACEDSAAGKAGHRDDGSHATYVRELVRSFPPLTVDQRDRLSFLLGPAAQLDTLREAA